MSEVHAVFTHLLIHLSYPVSECDLADPNLIFSQLRLMLASKGVYIYSFMPDILMEFTTKKSPEFLEKQLKKLKCDKKWSGKTRWLFEKVCDENDLLCQEEGTNRQISKEIKLNRLLDYLNSAVEEGYARKLVEQDVLSLLMDFCNTYEKRNRNIYRNCLKILSNIAVENRNCAIAIANSPWLLKLTSMINSKHFDDNVFAEKICLNALNALNMKRERFGNNVFKVYESDVAPIVDIVFIHGFKGSVFRTWHEKGDFMDPKKSQCWPRDWLPNDVDRPFRIICIDYNTSLVQFTGKLETLNVRSNRIIKQLKAAGVGERPLMFICHSMGGLLAKQIMLDDFIIRKETKGILFLATPHRGSPIANYAPLTIRPANDIRILHHRNVENKDLHNEFLSIAKEIRVICSVAELEKVPLIFRQNEFLVPVESAYFEYGSLYHVKEMHFNVCKPSSRTDKVYSIILRYINDVLSHVSQSKKY